MKFKHLTFLFFLSHTLVSTLNANTCDTYIHPVYGKGKCVHQDRCPGNNFANNYCENYASSSVKCCFSTPTAGCGSYIHPEFGLGTCTAPNGCSTSFYSTTGYCDNSASDYRCCYINQTAPLTKCGMSDTFGKGVCVQANNCPRNQYVLNTECDNSKGDLCCYSHQSDVNYYEFRGVWISTVANIDWPSKRTLTTAEQQSELLGIINTLYATGINAVVFQIRPVGDAFYNSPLEPWSVYLTNAQGKAPSPLWDPLQFVVDECHKRNMEVHAWLNPYRAKNKGETSAIAANHMINKFPQYAYSYAGYIWMDPAAAVVRNHTQAVIKDVLTRYDVDGIHFDDYFYPYPDGTEFPDQAMYDAYKLTGGALSKADWRRDNVNTMIRETYYLIKSIKPRVHFGISPFGIWRPGNPAGVVGMDSFNSIFADSKNWLQQGWLDYLAPQLYWEIDPPAQSYSALLRWWCEQNTKGKLIYGGTALYKLAQNNWPVTEIERQVVISRDYRNITSYGNIHFTTNYIMSNYKGIRDTLKKLYSTKVLTPYVKK